MKKTILIVICFLLMIVGHAQTSADRSLEVRVSITSSPLSFTLRWKKGLNAESYSVFKKSRKDTVWTKLTSSLGVNDTFYVDNSVTSGIGYEYGIKATSSVIPFSEYTYVYCADKFPANHLQGKIILLVDSSYITPLATEIKRLENDLISEGWIVIRKNIGRNQTKQTVKQFIVSTYLSDTARVKGTFILGHIAVPYSGFIAPDGHEEHEGAWPTDAYYCDTSFTYWTDTSVNEVNALRAENKNAIGDDKFDQNYINPNYLKLFSGRVDVYNMPAINSNDTFLMQQYLNKDHAYRTGQKKFRMQGLIDDNFGYFGDEAFAQNGWRNFNTLLTPDSVSTGDYATDMTNNSYLWSYGCGGGSYLGAGGVTSTTALQNLDLQSVFTMQFGSYFGDWDNQDNYLRAPLASKSSILTNCWAGRPNWFFHHMAMGEPIGSDALESCINRPTYLPTGYGRQMIHATLLGDPTLKMYVYDPPTNFVVTTISNSIAKLNWSASPASGVLGYYVYRTNSLTDSFTLLTPNYITGTSYNDNTAPIGKNIYMVRAVKLQSSSTGTFYNLSNGPIDSTIILSTVPIAINYFYGAKTITGNALHWSANCSSGSIGAELQHSANAINFDSIYFINADKERCLQPFAFTDEQNKTGINYYRLKITGADGKLYYSNIVQLGNNDKNALTVKTAPILISHTINFIVIASQKKQLKTIITDVTGRLIQSTTVLIHSGENSVKIDCSNLPAGIYNLTCFDENRQVYTSRFVK